MPSLNFKAEFAEAVELGKKRQTIRAKRKRAISAGDMLYFFTAMRTKSCRRLGQAICKAVYSVMIRGGQDLYIGYGPDCLRWVPWPAAELIAIHDGFRDYPDMAGWFSDVHGLPFEGDLILW